MNDGNRSDTSAATAGMSLPRPGDEIELNAAPMPVSLPYFSRHALSVLSAGFFISSFPSPDLGWLAWIALVPLLIACHGTSARRAAALGFLNGFVAAFGIYNWLFQLPAFGWRHAFVLATYVALYPSLFCFALAIFARWRAPLILSAPALWTIVEYLRANAGFLALPWGTLAQAQHENLAILQFASIAGEPGVTFLVVLGNATIAEMILRRRWRGPMIAAMILILAHAWGAWELRSATAEPNIKVAVIQPNIQIYERATPATREAIFKRLEELTRNAAESKPALIVWPESAIPGNLQSYPHTQARLWLWK
jgi:apolipoprotein N-acyltransferase